MRPRRSYPRVHVIGSVILSVTVIGVGLVPPSQARAVQAKQFALESTSGIRMKSLSAEPATLDGKKGLKITSAGVEEVAVIEGLEFANGIIEAELAGTPGPGAGEAARGFVGIAFRVSADALTFDAFYLRPTNGRAEDQERRNHATQYISHPEWTWDRLRKETPSRYEAYVDVMPGSWTSVRIEVRGDRARLYVNGNEQPTLIVNDVKTGASAKGAVALWLGPGTVAHFRNLTVRTGADAR
jgi:3-keto-disaccharide hydrolase